MSTQPHPAPPVPTLIRRLGEAIDWMTISIGAVIITLIISNVVLHLFKRDVAWTTELSELLMVWVTFIGGAAAARRYEHVAITELIDFLPAVERRIADGLIQLVSALVLVLLIWFGISIARSSWSNQFSVLGWPMSIEYLALPTASAAMLVFVLFDFVQIVRGRTRAERYPSS